MKKPGEKAKPLEGEDKANWKQVTHSLNRLVHALDEGASESAIAATLEDVKATPLDMQKVLNAIHLPIDAGEYAKGLENILRRIPDGWGRWISCGKGWYPLLTECDQALSEIDPNYVVHQVKEKYARLCYYYGSSETISRRKYLQMEKIVKTVERKARITCEDCGEPGVLMSTGGWDKTLCGFDALSTRYQPVPLSTKYPKAVLLTMVFGNYNIKIKHSSEFEKWLTATLGVSQREMRSYDGTDSKETEWAFAMPSESKAKLAIPKLLSSLKSDFPKLVLLQASIGNPPVEIFSKALVNLKIVDGLGN